MFLFIFKNIRKKNPVLAFLIFISTFLPSTANHGITEKLKQEDTGKEQETTLIWDDKADSSSLTITTIAEHLDVPWEIVWGPDNWIWFTEQSGAVSKINPETGEQK